MDDKNTTTRVEMLVTNFLGFKPITKFYVQSPKEDVEFSSIAPQYVHDTIEGIQRHLDRMDRSSQANMAYFSIISGNIKGDIMQGRNYDLRKYAHPSKK